MLKFIFQMKIVCNFIMDEANKRLI